MSSVSYDTDFPAWADEQASALRELARTRRDLSNRLDLEQIAEEVEDLGRADLLAVKSHLRQIFVHLIKLASAPDAEAAKHWRKEVIGFHNDLLDRFAPSMIQRIDLDALWRRAVREADASLAVHGQSIAAGVPSTCPLLLSDLATEEFDLDRAVSVSVHSGD